MFLSVLTVPTKRIALFAGSERWTAFLNNNCNGSDFVDYGYSVSRRLKARTVRGVDKSGRVWSRGKLKVVLSWEARVFTLFAADGHEEKSVYCMNDGGRWAFDSIGVQLPIEASFNSTAKAKRDRFTSKNLRDLLRSLEMPIITKHSLLTAHDLALVQQPGKPARTSTPEQEEDPAFGYYHRGLRWIPHMQTHAASVIADLERAVEIEPRYESLVRQHIEKANQVLRGRK